MNISEIVADFKSSKMFCEGANPSTQNKFVTSREAAELGLFGPLFHGTTSPAAKQNILENGFQFTEEFRTHGFGDYRNPIHPLGYGVYATPAKSRAKMYAAGVTRNIICLFVKFPPSQIPKVSYANVETMAKFWRKYGWEDAGTHDLGKQRAANTMQMTKNLAKASPVWFFKRPAFAGTLAETDQYCIYDTSLIYILDEAREKVEQKQNRPEFKRGDFVVADIPELSGQVFQILSGQNYNPPSSYLETLRQDKETGRLEQVLNSISEPIKRAFYQCHVEDLLSGETGMMWNVKSERGGQQPGIFQKRIRRITPSEAKKLQNPNT